MLRHALEHRVPVLNKFVEKIGHVHRPVLHPQMVDESGIRFGDFAFVAQDITDIQFFFKGLVQKIIGQILGMGKTLHCRVQITG